MSLIYPRMRAEKYYRLTVETKADLRSTGPSKD